MINIIIFGHAVIQRGTSFSFSAITNNVNSSTQYNDVTIQFDSANDGNNTDKTNNNFKYVLQYGIV